MSRNNPASSRFKISNPTLISTTSQAASSNLEPVQDYDYRGGNSSAGPSDGRLPPPTLGVGQVWNGSQAAPAPAPARRTNGDGGEPSRSAPKPTSPTRPARSRARGTPDDNLQIPPARSQRDVPPIATRQLSVHSNGGPESPTTPMSPEVPLPRGSPGGDPWAADRAQRTVARQQTNDSAQMASLRTPVSAGGNGGNALRNAAAAFMSASKQSRQDQQVGRRPPRSKRTQPSQDDWDDIIGTTGGRFAEIDGES